MGGGEKKEKNFPCTCQTILYTLFFFYFFTEGFSARSCIDFILVLNRIRSLDQLIIRALVYLIYFTHFFFYANWIFFLHCTYLWGKHSELFPIFIPIWTQMDWIFSIFPFSTFVMAIGKWQSYLLQLNPFKFIMRISHCTS